MVPEDSSATGLDEDFRYIGIVGERLVTVLADNLKEERSNSFSLSADIYHKFENAQVNLLVEGFYTDLNNVFALRQLDQPDSQGNTVQERYNAYGKGAWSKHRGHKIAKMDFAPGRRNTPTKQI